LISVNPCHHH